LQLNQQCEDRSVLRYVYYYLARILSDTGAQGLSSGGGIPTPNWDALADIDAVGGVTRADVVPRIVEQLTAASTNSETECEWLLTFNLMVLLVLSVRLHTCICICAWAYMFYLELRRSYSFCWAVNLNLK